MKPAGRFAWGCLLLIAACASSPQARPLDAGLPDAAVVDAGPQDGGATDAGLPDGGSAPVCTAVFAYPAGFPMDVLDAMLRRPNICKYLDLPLQHINDRLLASMRRGTTKAKTDALIAEIRARVPDIALRTSLIAGYPGETRKDHEEMLDWVRATRFDRLGVFEYSHEEDTRAFALRDDVSPREKKRRAAAVLAAQAAISREINEAKVGRTLKLIVDSRRGTRFAGRTEQDSPEVDNEAHGDAGKRGFQPGDFILARVTGASEYDLAVDPV
jgi:ribosomal protein S12 methylthiotransferase